MPATSTNFATIATPHSAATPCSSRATALTRRGPRIERTHRFESATIEDTSAVSAVSGPHRKPNATATGTTSALFARIGGLVVIRGIGSQEDGEQRHEA